MTTLDRYSRTCSGGDSRRALQRRFGWAAFKNIGWDETMSGRFYGNVECTTAIDARVAPIGRSSTPICRATAAACGGCSCGTDGSGDVGACAATTLLADGVRSRPRAGSAAGGLSKNRTTPRASQRSLRGGNQQRHVTTANDGNGSTDVNANSKLHGRLSAPPDACRPPRVQDLGDGPVVVHR